jgi:tRNA(Ile)-lysidine synthase TilS/MesJ
MNILLPAARCAAARQHKKEVSPLDNIKRILSFTRRAVDDYQMIRPGDKIAVGISGGKDSLTLLCALAELRRFYPNPFEVVAITIDMGFAEPMELSGVRELCERLNVPYHIVKTEIKLVIPYSTCIIFHPVHQRNLYVSFEKIVIRRTLRKIATIK